MPSNSGHSTLRTVAESKGIIRSESLKGARLRKKIKKSASLPCTPLSESVVEDGGEVLNVNRRVPYRNSTSADAGTKKDNIIEFAGLSKKDFTLMMFKHFAGWLRMKKVDSVPVLSKSRTQKFHKLFKTVPDNEYPVDYFSCAYIGDILLQGNLYVSQNWFCFYSRIRGRGRLLEIPMDSVISITREKTAIIFPNAIGLQTKKEKFAFGSFISRDSTYKFLVSMWKKSQEARTSEGNDGGASERIRSERSSSSFGQDSVFSNRNSSFNESGRGRNLKIPLSTQSHSNSKTDSTDNSDSSICIESGSVDASDNNDDDEPNDFSGKTDSNSSPTRKPGSHTGTSKRLSPGVSGVNREKKSTKLKSSKSFDGRRLQFPYSVLHCIDRERTMEAFQKSALKLQRIPRTNLLLAICTFLVLFLTLSAVGLTYKILNLEATLSSRLVWTDTDQQLHRDKSYHNVFDVEMSVRESTAQHMQNILSANLKMLEEINTSLHDLKTSTDKLHPADGGQCEGC